MSAQRALIPEEQRRLGERLWQPEAPTLQEGAPEPPPETWTPRADDLYVVVDDLDADLARLVVSVWPRLDGAARLVFRLLPSDSFGQSVWRKVLRRLLPTEDRQSITPDAQPYEFVFPARRSRFQGAVSASRTRLGQLGADRDLRIGDTFRAREIRSRDVTKWQDILDITAQARDAARAALLAAVAPKVAPGQVQALDTTTEPDRSDRRGQRRRSPGTVASSTV